MNNKLPVHLILLICMLPALAQAQLAPDQNPDFAISRDKYLKIADSLNTWHSTTFQETYKAVDWLEDRKQARTDRRAFRRQLRLVRAAWDGNYYYDNNYYYNNPYPYRGYGRGFYNNRYYNRGNGFYFSPWGPGYWWR